MKKMNMIWTKIAALALGAVMALGIGVTVISVSPISEAEAATTQTTRRVYVYEEGKDPVWTTDQMFIHYWGAPEGGSLGTNWNSCPEMKQVIDNYYSGLFYYDLPSDITMFLVKNKTGVPDNQCKSMDISIASLFPNGDFKVAVVGNSSNINGGDKRWAWAADCPGLSSDEAASILSTIDSCSSSYASGYNAWPQLNDLFVSGRGLVGSTIVNEVEPRPETTIALKTAYLEARYNADQASSAQNVLAPIDDKNRITITVLFSIIGLSLVGGLYFYSRKKQSSI